MDRTTCECIGEGLGRKYDERGVKGEEVRTRGEGGVGGRRGYYCGPNHLRVWLQRGCEGLEEEESVGRMY